MSNLTDSESERLTKLMEECAEIIQSVAKIQRFGYNSVYNGSSNRDRLENELCDLMLSFKMLLDSGDVSAERIDQYADAKRSKLNANLRYNQSK